MTVWPSAKACPVLTQAALVLTHARWSNFAHYAASCADFFSMLAGTSSTTDVERRRAGFFAERAIRVYAPAALMAAVCALEQNERGATALREAALTLCEKPTEESAWAVARVCTETYNNALLLDGPEAKVSQRVSDATAALHYTASAMRYTSDACDPLVLVDFAASVFDCVPPDTDDTTLRIVADDLRAAIAIT